MNHDLLLYIIVFLGAAVIAVPIFKRLGLGSILGYLAAGSIIGPFGIRLITDVSSIMHFAEFGVVLLLFIIGLELKPARLWRLRVFVFAWGSVQLFGSALLIAAVARLWGLAWLPAGIIGVGLSLSSTAFALQLLGERNELNTQFGQLSFGILLFQDLAVIPLLALLPALAPTVSATPMASTPVVLGVIGGIIFGGKYLLLPIFRIIAWTRTREIFTATALLLVLGIALIMQKIGLSMALGAFLAGVVLSESEYRHELEADIEPFKGLLLGLFFMTVGMSVNYGLVLRSPKTIVTLVVILVAAKSAILFLVGKMAKLTTASSRSMAATISQGGEFAFVLFGIAAQSGLVELRVTDLLSVVVTASMAVSPILVAINDRLLSRFWNAGAKPYDTINEDNPVIIAGFGRVGQMPVRLLRVKNIGFTALEQDSDQVEVARKFGQKIYYGDASRIDLLEAAGARNAKIFVLAIDDMEASLRTATVVKTHFPNLKIIARARNRKHAFELMDLGIDVIHRETFVSSLEMAGSVLLELGFTKQDVDESLATFRRHDEKSLKEQHKVHRDEKLLISFSKGSQQQLAELFQTDKSTSP